MHPIIMSMVLISFTAVLPKAGENNTRFFFFFMYLGLGRIDILLAVTVSQLFHWTELRVKTTGTLN